MNLIYPALVIASGLLAAAFFTLPFNPYSLYRSRLQKALPWGLFAASVATFAAVSAFA